MMNTKVWWAFLPLVQFVVAYPQNTLKMGRSVSCRADTEYPHSNICCLKCAAGQYVQTPCTETGKKGVCGECDYGTFTEHANGLKQCIKCTQCPPDQEIVRVCTHTQDTMCQCKPGRYCHPDEACEICKTCSRCKSDEEVVKNCTSTSNTECKKLQPKSKPGADAALTVGVAVPIVVLFVGFIIFIICWKKKYRTADSDNVKPDYVSVNEQCSTNPTLRNSLVNCTFKPQVEEEMKKLCESNTSSASSSQHNLTAPAASLSWEDPNRREEDLFPNLVPLNGVESLKECFGFFEELNMDFHKRFFRQLSLSDNMIRSKDNLPYEDRIHDLLTHWVEKEGEDASLEHLLRALLDLNQRRTAETIMQKAVQCGHYKQESLSLEDDD
ncbi:hematopoietic death receptor isoform 1-T1 [Anableps anableps]